MSKLTQRKKKIRNNIKYGFLLIGALSLLTLIVLGLSNIPYDNTKLVNNEMKSAYIGSGSIVELNDNELFNKSDTIVIGTVKEILPSEYGNQFSKDTDFGPDHIIYTDVIINVDEYLKNSLSSKEVRVRVTGGKIGNDSLLMEDEPSFKTGEKVLLFLTKDTSYATQDIGPDHFVVTGLSQGKYTLTDDGKATRYNETIPPDTLLNKIKG